MIDEKQIRWKVRSHLREVILRDHLLDLRMKSSSETSERKIKMLADSESIVSKAKTAADAILGSNLMTTVAVVDGSVDEILD